MNAWLKTKAQRGGEQRERERNKESCEDVTQMKGRKLLNSSLLSALSMTEHNFEDGGADFTWSSLLPREDFEKNEIPAIVMKRRQWKIGILK